MMVERVLVGQIKPWATDQNQAAIYRLPVCQRVNGNLTQTSSGRRTPCDAVTDVR